jgi:hypothetical protein
MESYPNDISWLAGLTLLILIVIIAMVLRNRAAKKDSVNRTEKDTIDDSVSLSPRKNTRKLD